MSRLRRARVSFTLAAAAGLAGFLLPQAVPAVVQAQAGSRSAPTYTPAQAALGKTAYDASCASCHGGNLDDGPFAPPLKGVAFITKYGGKSVDELFGKSMTMPPANPGALGGTTTAQVVAYILQSNAILAGTSELPTDQKALTAMTIPQGGFSFMAFSPYAPALPP